MYESQKINFVAMRKCRRRSRNDRTRASALLFVGAVLAFGAVGAGAGGGSAAVPAPAPVCCSPPCAPPTGCGATPGHHDDTRASLPQRREL